MTENEAINELLDYVGDAFKTTISVETVTLAREALEEIQRQKTKIGMFVTLEEKMEISSRFAKLEQYEAIGTIEEFKALKEKIAKIEFILNEKNYIKADECDYGNYYTCENALMIKDIEEIING